jgi:uncharacterized protein (DUF1810 family)
MDDPHHLQRFIDAQDACITQVRAELLDGRKRSHWMWFVFPQISGLGVSPMAQRFAISGLAEARAYLMHPELGRRLRDCTTLVNAVESRPIGEIFAYPDDLKFHSSMTLFAYVASRDVTDADAANQVFANALTKYFNGVADQATLDRLPKKL